jgi:predicted transcriptional regulator
MSFYLMHRGWMDNEVFSDEPFTDCLAWVWLIQEASFEPHRIRYKNKMIEVGIGQVPISYRRLVEKWKWGIHRVRNFLDLLESEQMITRETATGFLIITVCNYEKYQKPFKISTTQATTPTATLPTTPTATNIKNINKFNKGKIKEYTSDFETLWTLYPRKDGSKAKAFESYQSAIKSGVEYGRIESGVRAFSDSVKRENTEQRYIAHFVTWLNGKRWESDYASKQGGDNPPKSKWLTEGDRIAAKYLSESQ